MDGTPLEPGDHVVPTKAELQERCGVSRSVVRQALASTVNTDSVGADSVGDTSELRARLNALGPETIDVARELGWATSADPPLRTDRRIHTAAGTCIHRRLRG